jgi:hypothetical protein
MHKNIQIMLNFVSQPSDVEFQHLFIGILRGGGESV